VSKKLSRVLAYFYPTRNSLNLPTSFRFLPVNATTRRDAEGNVVGVVGVAQDVTEAAQHDRAVAAMANELRQLVVSTSRSILTPQSK